MDKRKLGNSGIEVSEIGYGCMGLTHAYGKPLDEDDAVGVIHAALDDGYTFFDTAEIYGTTEDPFANERVVGKALADVRDEVVIATKFGIRFDRSAGLAPYPVVVDSSPERIRESIEGSLRRLGTDHIDLYYQHRIDPNTPAEVVAETMGELIAEGKIRAWGISEADGDYLRRANAVCPVSAVQNRYSMMARWHESLFPVLEELDVAFVAFSPLANGLLSGAYGKGASYDAKYDYRANMPQFTDDAMDENERLLQLVGEVAARHDATLSQVSLAWMLSEKPYIIPIPGSRNPERVAENARAADVRLSDEEVADINAALDAIPMSEVFGGAKIISK